MYMTSRQANRPRRSPSPTTLRSLPTPTTFGKGTKAARNSTRPQLTALPTPTSTTNTTTQRFLKQRSLPLWLQLLLRVQRSSVIAAFGLVGIALFIYGSTVYTQQLWGKEYRALKALQKNERQFVTASEALKSQLAQQAEQPGSKLIPRSPTNLIFLPPAEPRPVPVVQPAMPTSEFKSDVPLGY